MIIGILLCFCVEMTNTGFCFVLLKYFCYYIKLSILYIFIYLFGHCVPLARDHQETVHSSSSSSFTKLVFLCLASSDDVFFLWIINKYCFIFIRVLLERSSLDKVFAVCWPGFLLRRKGSEHLVPLGKIDFDVISSFFSFQRNSSRNIMSYLLKVIKK